MLSLPLDEIFLGLELLAKRDLASVDSSSAEHKAVMIAQMVWGYLTDDNAGEAAKRAATGSARDASNPDKQQHLRKAASLRSAAHETARAPPAQVAALIGRMTAARPDLLEPQLAERAGLGRVAGMLGADRGDLPALLSDYLDAEALHRAAAAVALLEDGVRESGAAAHQAQFPVHVDVLKEVVAGGGAKASRNPWTALAMAFLGSPKVHFTTTGQRMARFAGHGVLVRSSSLQTWDARWFICCLLISCASMDFGSLSFKETTTEGSNGCDRLTRGRLLSKIGWNAKLLSPVLPPI